MSELRPYDPSNPEFISSFDQKEMMKALKSIQFQKQVDRELSYAYSIRRKAARLNKKGIKFLEVLDNGAKEK